MKISVIVPVYDVERYLDRCMSSLLAQIYPNWEIVLVDDGSTDNSGRICDRYAAQDARIRAIHRENGGLGMARNTGMEAARGEYILFLDPDDYFGPDLLSGLAEAAERTGADLVIGGHTIVDADGRRKPCAASCERLFDTPEEIGELLLHTVGTPPEEQLDSRYGVSACGRLYRREIVQRGGLQFASERLLISEDLIFNMDLLRWADRVAVTTGASYFYCTNDGSLSNRHREDRFEKDLVLCRAVEERLEQWYPREAYQLSLSRLLISRARYDIVQEVDYHDLADRSYPLREKVVQIVGSRELRGALESYPWRKLPWMQGIFAWLMKGRQVWALLALARLKRRFLK